MTADRGSEGVPLLGRAPAEGHFCHHYGLRRGYSQSEQHARRFRDGVRAGVSRGPVRRSRLAVTEVVRSHDERRRVQEMENHALPDYTARERYYNAFYTDADVLQMSTYIVAYANGHFGYLESSYTSPLSGATRPLRIYGSQLTLHNDSKPDANSPQPRPNCSPRRNLHWTSSAKCCRFTSKYSISNFPSPNWIPLW